MNCANHPDRERAAFCQNCGKPLCTECMRQSGTSIFCEPCLNARGNATVPPAGYAGYPPVGQPATHGQPNPALAALLGFIPGVGAMYNEQYGKGIVHLIVFAILVSLSHDSGIFGLFIAGWVFYMVIEAHHTARARRDGTPLPNPFGLNDIAERLGFGRSWPGTHGAAPFVSTPPPAGGAPPDAGPGYAPPASPYAPPYSYPYTPPVSHWGAPQDAYNYGVPPVAPIPPVSPGIDPNLPAHRRFPAGAAWLIGLGLLFLFGNTGMFHILPGRLFGPFLLIGIGVWTFVRKMTSTGHGIENDGTPYYRWRLSNAMHGSMWVMLVGFIWLLDVLRILRWSSSWPLFLIGGGILLILRRTMFSGYEYGPVNPPYPGAPVTPPAPQVTSTGIVPSGPQSQLDRDDREGR